MFDWTRVALSLYLTNTNVLAENVRGMEAVPLMQQARQHLVPAASTMHFLIHKIVVRKIDT